MSLHAYSWLNCFLPWLQFCITRLQQAETASGSICCTVSQWWLRSRHTQGKSSNLQGTIAFTSFSFEYICIHCCLPLDRFCIKNTIHNFGLISYRWWPIPRKSLPCVTRLSSKANVDSLFTNVGALTQPRDLIKNELQRGGKEREKKVVILQRLCKVYWWFTYLMSNHELLRTTITGNFCMGKSPRTIKGRYYPPYWRTCMESLPFQNLRRLVRFFRHHFCCQWYLRRFVFHILVEVLLSLSWSAMYSDSGWRQGTSTGTSGSMGSGASKTAVGVPANPRVLYTDQLSKKEKTVSVTGTGKQWMETARETLI